jgi:hypothetical protein
MVQSQTLKGGIRTKNSGNVLGKWCICIIFHNFKPNQFFIGFDYVTSRFGSAYNPNAKAR